MDINKILSEADTFLSELSINDLRLFMNVHDRMLINGNKKLQEIRNGVDINDRESIINWLINPNVLNEMEK